MIKLNNAEKQFIKMTKMHYKDVYPCRNNWVLTFKPLFEEIYGWNPNSDLSNYRRVLFNKLLEIHLKIHLDGSGSDQQLKGIFDAAFNRSFSRDHAKPIDRAISELCGLLQCNQVIEDGVPRYNLDL